MMGLLRRTFGSLWTRAILTALLLAAVLSSVDWQQMYDRLAAGDPIWGAAAVVCVAAALWLGALRWQLLLHNANIELPFLAVVRIYLIGSFVNGFLPTAVGGDLARPLLVSRKNPGLVRAATTVLVERLFALAALLLLGWIGVALAPEQISEPVILLLLAASIGAAAIGAIMWLRPRRLRHGLGRFVPDTFRDHVQDVTMVAHASTRRDGRLVGVVTTSVGFQILVTMQIVFLARAISIEVAFGVAAVALAIVTVTLFIPISIGGFGLREGAYVGVLAGAGIGTTDAVLISLLSVPVLLLATLPGAVALITSGVGPVLRQGAE